MAKTAKTAPAEAAEERKPFRAKTTIRHGVLGDDGTVARAIFKAGETVNLTEAEAAELVKAGAVEPADAAKA